MFSRPNGHPSDAGDHLGDHAGGSGRLSSRRAGRTVLGPVADRGQLPPPQDDDEAGSAALPDCCRRTQGVVHVRHHLQPGSSPAYTSLMTQKDIAARVEWVTNLSAGFGREIELLRKKRLDPIIASGCAGLFGTNPGRSWSGMDDAPETCELAGLLGFCLSLTNLTDDLFNIQQVASAACDEFNPGRLLRLGFLLCTLLRLNTWWQGIELHLYLLTNNAVNQQG
jgi:hypothetical protein